MATQDQRLLITRELMKSFGRFKNQLPVHRGDGSSPMVVAFTSDRVSYVVQHVANAGGRANVIVVPENTPPGDATKAMAVVGFESAQVEGHEDFSPAAIHHDIRMDMLLDWIMNHHDGRASIQISGHGPSAEIPEPGRVLELV